MRQIKFRGYDIKNKRWIYGYYVKHLPYTPYPMSPDPEKYAKEVEKDYVHVIMYDGFSDWGMDRNTQHNVVDGNSIGQFTGLIDKNGVEIYEGDLLKYVGTKCPYCDSVNFYPNHLLYTISWNEEDACFECLSADNYMTPEVWIEMEVIGNIYQNQELLGEVKE